MLKGVVNFAIGGFFGGGIGGLLSAWEQQGFFSYVLPFLLIFSIVFGILMKIKVLGDNKAINSVIALSVGLLALQFDLVPIFFSEIFPRTGIALSVVLVFFVLVGLFLPSRSVDTINYLFVAIAVIIFLVVISKSFEFSFLGGNFAFFWSNYYAQIISAIVIIAAIGFVINSFGTRRPLLPPWPAGGPPYWHQSSTP